MTTLSRPDGTSLYYEVFGAGHSVLLLADGAPASQIERHAENPLKPIENLARFFRVIAMDERHAGRSLAATESFGYADAADDQLAVLDACGVERVSILATGTGCVHAWSLARRARKRVTAIVCQEPVGLTESNGYGTFLAPYDETIRVARGHGMDSVVRAAQGEPRFDRAPAGGPYAQRIHAQAEFAEKVRRMRVENYITRVIRFRDALWPTGSPYFAVPAAWMAENDVPMFVLPGSTLASPPDLARRLVREAKVVCCEPQEWSGSSVERTLDRVTTFLSEMAAH